MPVVEDSTVQDDLTAHLRRWSDGDRKALDTIFPIVYQILHQIASRYLRKERHEHTLQTTALVHEAYLKLVNQHHVQWHSRSHFFAISSQIMRRLLVDHARSRGSSKRGGAAILLSLDEALVIGHDTDSAVLLLHEALTELTKMDPELAQIIELRFFGGLSNEEIADVLDVSARTVIRRWRTAQAWLYRYLQVEADNDEP